ncbi:MAG: ABC transporter ATP-binding protein [Rhodospirillaceae bacterium]
MTEMPSSVSRADAYVNVDGVRKIYNPGPSQVEAVAEAHCRVREGEFVSLLGPSGCGKSTLLMMVAGLEEPSTGRIDVGGTPMNGTREDIGLMFQDPTLLPWKTALENVMFPIKILKRPPEQYRDTAVRLLTRVGLGDFLDKKPGQLSGGMRQRVAICRALIYDPSLLLMDEPFSALDAITRDEMNQVLMDMWQEFRKTGLFVTHSIRESVFLSDRVLVMSARPGRIIADVTIPFDRPRDFSIVEGKEFNEICAYLRSKIMQQEQAGAEAA